MLPLAASPVQSGSQAQPSRGPGPQGNLWARQHKGQASFLPPASTSHAGLLWLGAATVMVSTPLSAPNSKPYVSPPHLEDSG